MEENRRKTRHVYILKGDELSVQLNSKSVILYYFFLKAPESTSKFKTRSNFPTKNEIFQVPEALLNIFMKHIKGYCLPYWSSALQI